MIDPSLVLLLPETRCSPLIIIRLSCLSSASDLALFYVCFSFAAFSFVHSFGLRSFLYAHSDRSYLTFRRSFLYTRYQHLSTAPEFRKAPL